MKEPTRLWGMAFQRTAGGGLSSGLHAIPRWQALFQKIFLRALGERSAIPFLRAHNVLKKRECLLARVTAGKVGFRFMVDQGRRIGPGPAVAWVFKKSPCAKHNPRFPLKEWICRLFSVRRIRSFAFLGPSDALTGLIASVEDTLRQIEPRPASDSALGRV